VFGRWTCPGPWGRSLDASDGEMQPRGRNWENRINLLLVVHGYKVFIFIGLTLPLIQVYLYKLNN